MSPVLPSRFTKRLHQQCLALFHHRRGYATYSPKFSHSQPKQKHKRTSFSIISQHNEEWTEEELSEMESIESEKRMFLQFVEENRAKRGVLLEYLLPTRCNFRNCCRRWGSPRSVCVMTFENVRQDPPLISHMFYGPDDYPLPRTFISLFVLVSVLVIIRFMILLWHGNHPNQVHVRDAMKKDEYTRRRNERRKQLESEKQQTVTEDPASASETHGSN